MNKYALCLTLTCTFIGAQSHAQERLKWESMEAIEIRGSVLSQPGFSHLPKGGPDDHALALNIWDKELKTVDAALFPSVLQKTFNFEGKQYTFSILNSSFQDCEPPANGKDVVDMYSICPLKVGRIDEKTFETNLSVHKNYCFLLVDNSPGDKTNETQFLWDKKTRTAYFRVIQYGKVVPACNRAIRIH